MNINNIAEKTLEVITTDEGLFAQLDGKFYLVPRPGEFRPVTDITILDRLKIDYDEYKRTMREPFHYS